MEQSVYGMNVGLLYVPRARYIIIEVVCVYSLTLKYKIAKLSGSQIKS